MSARGAIPVAFAPDPFVCQRSSDALGSVCLHLEGELDLATAPQLEHALRGDRRDERLVVLEIVDLDPGEPPTEMLAQLAREGEARTAPTAAARPGGRSTRRPAVNREHRFGAA